MLEKIKGCIFNFAKACIIFTYKKRPILNHSRPNIGSRPMG